MAFSDTKKRIFSPIFDQKIYKTNYRELKCSKSSSKTGWSASYLGAVGTCDPSPTCPFIEVFNG